MHIAKTVTAIQYGSVSVPRASNSTRQTIPVYMLQKWYCYLFTQLSLNPIRRQFGCQLHAPGGWGGLKGGCFVLSENEKVFGVGENFMAEECTPSASFEDDVAIQWVEHPNLVDVFVINECKVFV